jgi:hypothetical protein
LDSPFHCPKCRVPLKHSSYCSSCGVPLRAQSESLPRTAYVLGLLLCCLTMGLAWTLNGWLRVIVLYGVVLPAGWAYFSFLKKKIRKDFLVVSEKEWLEERQALLDWKKTLKAYFLFGLGTATGSWVLLTSLITLSILPSSLNPFSEVFLPLFAGIVLVGVLAIPIRRWICSRGIKEFHERHIK